MIFFVIGQFFFWAFYASLVALCTYLSLRFRYGDFISSFFYDFQVILSSLMCRYLPLLQVQRPIAILPTNCAASLRTDLYCPIFVYTHPHTQVSLKAASLPSGLPVDRGMTIHILPPPYPIRAGYFLVCQSPLKYLICDNLCSLFSLVGDVMWFICSS